MVTLRLREWVYLCAFAVTCSLLCIQEALALYPGDCGKAGVSGRHNITSGVAAGDALAILQAVVRNQNCTKKICNVDYLPASDPNWAPANGAVFASDALAVLKKAAGHVGVTLTCNTECEADECVCDNTDLFYVLDHADDPNVNLAAGNGNPPVPAAPGVLALLHCPPFTEFSVTP